ncbi:MAG: 2-phospho-L-lactate guanylyltransferase [Acidimicrobiales bacterium]
MRALLVPVKAFEHAKARLSPVLSTRQRAMLARHLADGVIGAAPELARFVVCDDEDVAKWARSRGAEVLWTPGLGLSGAVGAGVFELAGRGYHTVVVAHADLAHPEGLGELGTQGAVSLVPDRRRDGTNVIVLPSESGFRFSYGAGSFGRHRTEAARLGLSCVLIADTKLAIDIDLPEDLDLVAPVTLEALEALECTVGTKHGLVTSPNVCS